MMKAFFLGLTKLILGVSMALVLLSLSGVATARYFMAKLSVLPPKPVFENDVALQTQETATPAEAQPAPAAPAPTPPCGGDAPRELCRSGGATHWLSDAVWAGT